MTEDQVEASDSGSVEHLWRAIQKNRWIILVLAAVVTASVTFYTLGETRIYRATTTLQIDPTPPSPLGRDVPAIVTMGADAFWNNQEYYSTQYRILRSRRVALDAVRALQLQNNGAFIQNLPPGHESDKHISEREASDIVLSRLTIEPIKESRLVMANFDDADPERARRILAAVVDAYLQQNVDDVAASNSSASDWLRVQSAKLKDQLEKSEVALHEYKKNKRILSVSLDDQSSMLLDEMKHLNDALTDVRTRREHTGSRVKLLDKVNANDPVDLPAAELLSDDLLGSLRASYVSAKSELASLRESGKGDDHPDVLAAKARVETARDALVHEVKNVQAALRGDLAALGREEGGLEKLFEAAKQRALDLGMLEVDVHRLARAKDNNEKLYSMVLERSKESDLASMMRFNNIRIVEDPIASRTPVTPRVPLNVGLGVAAGLALGLLVAFAREQLDRSIKTSDEIERELGLSFLGSLPLTNAPEAPLVTNPELLAHEHPTSNLAEAARGIRTNLMFMSPDRPYRRLLVTSPGPGEGKTTVASTIAIAMAQAGQRVLLMDCDLRRPRLHGVFGRVNDLGVTSVTVQPSLLDTAKLETEIPNLSLLPSGPHVPNPAEFLHSEAFSALLNRLSETYDRVVIDSPPAGVVSDATIIGTQVDGVVFLVRSGRTPRDNARKALRALRDIGAPIIGAVLNALDPVRLGYGRHAYYQYGYYGYGYGRDDSADDKS